MTPGFAFAEFGHRALGWQAPHVLVQHRNRTFVRLDYYRKGKEEKYKVSDHWSLTKAAAGLVESYRLPDLPGAPRELTTDFHLVQMETGALGLLERKVGLVSIC